MVHPDNRCLCLSVWVRTSQFIKNKMYNVGDNGLLYVLLSKMYLPSCKIYSFHSVSTSSHLSISEFFGSAIGYSYYPPITLLLRITFIIRGASTMNMVHSRLQFEIRNMSWQERAWPHQEPIIVPGGGVDNDKS